MSSEPATETTSRAVGVHIMSRLPTEVNLLISEHLQTISDSLSEHQGLLRQLATSYPSGPDSPYTQMHEALKEGTKDILYLGNEDDWHSLFSTA